MTRVHKFGTGLKPMLILLEFATTIVYSSWDQVLPGLRHPDTEPGDQ